MTRAVKLQAKASSAGFDRKDPRLVLAKIREETDKIEVTLDAREPAAVAEEIGKRCSAIRTPAIFSPFAVAVAI